MVRLPLEISSEILARCLPKPPRPNPGEAPLLFQQICHSWSTIALSTPSLWSTIYRESPDAADLELWISRARSLPLSLFLHGNLSSEVAVVVKRHAPRVQSLDLGLEHPNNLKEITAHFPSLKRLKVFDAMGRGYQGSSYLWACMDALHAAPALVECELSLSTGADSYPSDIVPLKHRCLRHLRLGQRPGEAIFQTANILNYLPLPALESLCVWDLDIPDSDFNSFLARSSPSLQTLSIGANEDHNIISDGWLQLLPGLTALTLDCSGNHTIRTFLQTIASTSSILPNLRNLTIRGFYLNDNQYRQIVGLLAARCNSRLESLRVLLPGETVQPNDQTLARLREFARDGMRIHVGPERSKHNYV
ncbi:hypothetical protein DFH06DRAFT_1340898 [Mycena polygramma]|nr:hypothetical protein DFH06DRAFT_1340898 [Mycena polygramma]